MKIEYDVAVHSDINELITEVNRMIGKGWFPIGGIATKSYKDDCVFFQAMTRSPLSAVT